MDPAGRPGIVVFEAPFGERPVIGGFERGTSRESAAKFYTTDLASTPVATIDAVIGHSDMYLAWCVPEEVSDGDLSRRLGAWGRKRRFRSGDDMCLHTQGHRVLSVGPTPEGEEAGRFWAGLGDR